jgi:cytoskeletal protein RodZ
MSESKPTLGEFLRHERESRGITIEQVASATKIGVRLLHALESDQYAELPAKPFVRGFVTSYCRFVGLDYKDILTRFSSFVEEKAQDRPRKDAGHSGYAFERREGEQSRVILAAVMGGFVVLGGALFFFLKPSLHHHRGTPADKLRLAHETPGPSATPEPTDSVKPSGTPQPLHSLHPLAPPTFPPVAKTTPTPAPIEAPIPLPTFSATPTLPPPAPEPTHSSIPEDAPSPAPTPASTEKPDPLDSGVNLPTADIKQKVTLKVLERVWVRYQVDDRPVRKIILRKGGLLVLRAQTKVVLQVSDPKFLSYNYNSQGFKEISEENGAEMRHGNFTLFFPKQLSEKIKEPFPGQKPLSSIVPPPPKLSAPLSTPTPEVVHTYTPTYPQGISN